MTTGEDRETRFQKSFAHPKSQFENPVTSSSLFLKNGAKFRGPLAPMIQQPQTGVFHDVSGQGFCRFKKIFFCSIDYELFHQSRPVFFSMSRRTKKNFLRAKTSCNYCFPSVRKQ